MRGPKGPVSLREAFGGSHCAAYSSVICRQSKYREWEALYSVFSDAATPHVGGVQEILGCCMQECTQGPDGFSGCVCLHFLSFPCLCNLNKVIGMLVLFT